MIVVRLSFVVLDFRATAIKAKYPSVSYADLWTLAGATAIKHMGGPQVAWSSGRTDSDKPTTVPDGECEVQQEGDGDVLISCMAVVAGGRGKER